jgi:hypothetical protein
MTLWQRDDLKIAWRRATPAMEALRPPIFPEKEPPPLQQVFSTSLQYSESAPFLDYYENDKKKIEKHMDELGKLLERYYPPPDPHKKLPDKVLHNLFVSETVKAFNNRYLYDKQQQPPYPAGTMLPLRLLGKDVLAVVQWHTNVHNRAWEFRFPKTGQHPPQVLNRNGKIKKFFIGMDCTTCQVNEIEWLSRTNVDWIGIYLGKTRTGAHGDRSWMPHLKTLRDKNLGVAPIYWGHQAIEAKGKIPVGDPVKDGDDDAADAVKLANEFRNYDPQQRLSPRAVIYLDIETPMPDVSKMVDYYKAWAKGVSKSNFWPGVYCSASFAGNFKAAVPEGRVWATFFPKRNPTFPKLNTWLASPKYPFPVVDPAGAVKAPRAENYWGADIEIWQCVLDKSIIGLPTHYDLSGSVIEDPSVSPLDNLEAGAPVKWE